MLIHPLAVHFPLALRQRRANRVAGILLALSLTGAILVAVTGWLGGELRNVM